MYNYIQRLRRNKFYRDSAKGRNIKMFHARVCKIIKGMVGCSLLLSCLTAGAASGAEKTLVVSAAISLKDALTRLAADFEKNNGQAKILFNFGSTGQLRAQIENGAPADVFASAASEDMDKLSQKKMIIESSRINLVANRLVLIRNGKRVISLKDINDLTSDTIRRIAIGNPDTVPAGHYARDSLNYYYIYEKLRQKLIFGENVRQVLDYVARGEVDAGLVYATDAVVEKQVVVVMKLPDETHKPIIYPAAVIKASKNVELAGEFIRFIHSPESAGIFREYGFVQGK
jgi:molybdate transport system substrate-binding protein